jgi:hypothetical protein
MAEGWTFSGLTTAELTSMKDAIVTRLTSGLTSGVQKYQVEGRKLEYLNLKELAELLDALSNELARRALGDVGSGLGIGLIGFEEA